MGAGADSLKAAIEEAWRVFDIPAPATTGVCRSCCMDPAIEADFLKKKARDLPDAYIRDWYFAACDSQISYAHVAWFLPRVMEILAAGKSLADVGEEVAFKRLPLTGFPTEWGASQINAVERFALAFLDAQIDAERNGWRDLDGWLCMFGIGGLDMLPLLARLEAMPDADLAALLHLDWGCPQNTLISMNPFWDGHAARHMVWEWYTSTNLMARMEAAAMGGDMRALDVFCVIANTRLAFSDL